MRIWGGGSGFPWTYDHLRRLEDGCPQGEGNFGLGTT
jgi:hypothetical protein